MGLGGELFVTGACGFAWVTLSGLTCLSNLTTESGLPGLTRFTRREW